MSVVWLRPDDPFPPAECWDHDDGLIAVGGGISVDRMLDAYSRGIFPWDFYQGHPLWFCPPKRIVFDPGTWRPHRRLARTLRTAGFRFTVDQAFVEVLRHCATVPRPGQHGTWIKPSYARTLLQMHARGFAHSVECWKDDRLAGGLYGISLGAVFCGESMFHRERDASKAAFTALVAACRLMGITLIDGQIPNPHLKNMGGTEMPRDRFLTLLRRCLPDPPYQGTVWCLDETQLAAAMAALSERSGRADTESHEWEKAEDPPGNH